MGEEKVVNLEEWEDKLNKRNRLGLDQKRNLLGPQSTGIVANFMKEHY